MTEVLQAVKKLSAHYHHKGQKAEGLEHQVDDLRSTNLALTRTTEVLLGDQHGLRAQIREGEDANLSLTLARKALLMDQHGLEAKSGSHRS